MGWCKLMRQQKAYSRHRTAATCLPEGAEVNNSGRRREGGFQEILSVFGQVVIFLAEAAVTFFSSLVLLVRPDRSNGRWLRKHPWRRETAPETCQSYFSKPVLNKTCCTLAQIWKRQKSPKGIMQTLLWFRGSRFELYCFHKKKSLMRISS